MPQQWLQNSAWLPIIQTTSPDRRRIDTGAKMADKKCQEFGRATLRASRDCEKQWNSVCFNSLFLKASCENMGKLQLEKKLGTFSERGIIMLSSKSTSSSHWSSRCFSTDDQFEKMVHTSLVRAEASSTGVPSRTWTVPQHDEAGAAWQNAALEISCFKSEASFPGC